MKKILFLTTALALVGNVGVSQQAFTGEGLILNDGGFRNDDVNAVDPNTPRRKIVGEDRMNKDRNSGSDGSQQSNNRRSGPSLSSSTVRDGENGGEGGYNPSRDTGSEAVAKDNNVGGYGATSIYQHLKEQGNMKPLESAIVDGAMNSRAQLEEREIKGMKKWMEAKFQQDIEKDETVPSLYSWLQYPLFFNTLYTHYADRQGSISDFKIDNRKAIRSDRQPFYKMANRNDKPFSISKHSYGWPLMKKENRGDLVGYYNDGVAFAEGAWHYLDMARLYGSREAAEGTYGLYSWFINEPRLNSFYSDYRQTRNIHLEEAPSHIQTLGSVSKPHPNAKKPIEFANDELSDKVLKALLRSNHYKGPRALEGRKKWFYTDVTGSFDDLDGDGVQEIVVFFRMEREENDRQLSFNPRQRIQGLPERAVDWPRRVLEDFARPIFWEAEYEKEVEDVSNEELVEAVNKIANEANLLADTPYYFGYAILKQFKRGEKTVYESVYENYSNELEAIPQTSIVSFVDTQKGQLAVVTQGGDMRSKAVLLWNKYLKIFQDIGDFERWTDANLLENSKNPLATVSEMRWKPTYLEHTTTPEMKKKSRNYSSPPLQSAAALALYEHRSSPTDDVLGGFLTYEKKGRTKGYPEKDMMSTRLTKPKLFKKEIEGEHTIRYTHQKGQFIGVLPDSAGDSSLFVIPNKYEQSILPKVEMTGFDDHDIDPVSYSSLYTPKEDVYLVGGEGGFVINFADNISEKIKGSKYEEKGWVPFRIRYSAPRSAGVGCLTSIVANGRQVYESQDITGCLINKLNIVQEMKLNVEDGRSVRDLILQFNHLCSPDGDKVDDIYKYAMSPVSIEVSIGEFVENLDDHPRAEKGSERLDEENIVWRALEFNRLDIPYKTFENQPQEPIDVEVATIAGTKKSTAKEAIDFTKPIKALNEGVNNAKHGAKTLRFKVQPKETGIYTVNVRTFSNVCRSERCLQQTEDLSRDLSYDIYHPITNITVKKPLYYQTDGISNLTEVRQVTKSPNTPRQDKVVSTYAASPYQDTAITFEADYDAVNDGYEIEITTAYDFRDIAKGGDVVMADVLGEEDFGGFYEGLAMKNAKSIMANNIKPSSQFEYIEPKIEYIVGIKEIHEQNFVPLGQR